RALPPLPRY
nr:Chain R, PROLINE-RICH LIGAND RLP2 (RALPPLPRY) [unidentified]1RLQ_R Chain R, PROLINE-RICH LIGAND RLP2 (RALPPLPRY) [unidentified]